MNNTFSQRCKYQCINNAFTNDLIDFSLAGPDANNILADTHKRVEEEITEKARRMFDFRYPSGVASIDFLFEQLTMQYYIFMEDNLRAQGYFECSGPINTADSDSSIDLIASAIEEIVLPVIGEEAAKFSRQIEFHLNRTKEIYRRKLRAKQ